MFFVFPVKACIVDSTWVDSIKSYAVDIDAITKAEIIACVFQSLYGHEIKDRSGQEINDIVQLGVYIFNDMPLDVYDGRRLGLAKAENTTALWFWLL